jgi:exopolysaccharide biosynthesis predicted pyruvyltransferase EpsI
MEIEFLLLKEKIKSLKPPLYYMPNPGNWGDALILHGTLKYFSKIGVTPFFWSPTDVSGLLAAPKGCVIFGGGGAWSNTWKGGSIRVRDISNSHDVLVLPSTYESFFPIKNKSNIYFRRDEFNSKEILPESYFCHDMAFLIGRIKTKPGAGTGYFFRLDKETSGRIKIPSSNIDISKKGTESTGISNFFSTIAQFSEIHTDRLHVSIACALMNRKCFLYEGSYFKNQSVFLSSICRFSDSVRFVDQDLTGC